MINQNLVNKKGFKKFGLSSQFLPAGGWISLFHSEICDFEFEMVVVPSKLASSAVLTLVQNGLTEILKNFVSHHHQRLVKLSLISLNINSLNQRFLDFSNHSGQ